MTYKIYHSSGAVKVIDLKDLPDKGDPKFYDIDTATMDADFLDGLYKSALSTALSTKGVTLRMTEDKDPRFENGVLTIWPSPLDQRIDIIMVENQLYDIPAGFEVKIETQEISTRHLVYMFLGLPYHKQVKIAQAIKVYDDIDAGLPQQESSKLWFQRAKKEGKITNLKEHTIANAIDFEPKRVAVIVPVALPEKTEIGIFEYIDKLPITGPTVDEYFAGLPGVQPQPEESQEVLQTVDANMPQYIALTNISTMGFDRNWLELWEQIEIWYGDPRAEESGIDLLTRLKSKFTITRNLKNSAEEK